MTVTNPNFHDIHLAGLSGMGNIQGDVEVLEDLGIPASPETFDSHVASSQEAAALSPRPLDADERERWLQSFHFTGVQFDTPDGRHHRSEGVAQLRGNIQPTKEPGVNR